jgi:hypothetical protein
MPWPIWPSHAPVAHMERATNRRDKLEFRPLKVRKAPDLERATGIEPAPPAWKAGALPLSYARAERGPA